MIRFINIGSGSKGNATLIYNHDTLIQVDMGVPLYRLKEGLERIGKSVEDIKGVFITHDHSDHIGTIQTIKKIPTYTAFGNLPFIDCIVEPFEELEIGSFRVKVLKTSHDATNPIGFIFSDDEQSMLYMTDTGYIPEESLGCMKNCDYYIIESNHDIVMLKRSHRPKLLKDRILSDHGHLSNVDSASYIAGLIGENTKCIYLAHLSEECNTEEKAINTYCKTFDKLGVEYPVTKIIPLKQWEMVEGGDL